MQGAGDRVTANPSGAGSAGLARCHGPPGERHLGGRADGPSALAITLPDGPPIPLPCSIRRTLSLAALAFLRRSSLTRHGSGAAGHRLAAATHNASAPRAAAARPNMERNRRWSTRGPVRLGDVAAAFKRAYYVWCSISRSALCSSSTALPEIVSMEHCSKSHWTQSHCF